MAAADPATKAAPRAISMPLGPPESDAPPAPVAGAPEGRAALMGGGVVVEPLLGVDDGVALGDGDDEALGDGDDEAPGDGDVLGEVGGLGGPDGADELVV